MMPVFVGAIADDDTGATDLAGMLTGQGMHAIILFGSASYENLKKWASGMDAVIIGTASRSIAKDEAYRRTAAAAEALMALQPRVLAVKYCSTFDSTAEGNLGASIDAAMDVMGERFTVALPALPALGRTTYMGYHFVGEKLLSDSVLRHHPLNPMTDPHLPSHLCTQTNRRVGLATFGATNNAEALRKRMTELQTEGVSIAVLDCVNEANLREIGEAVHDMPLLTGSSAWAMVLPKIWREQGALPQPAMDITPARESGGTGFLIVSGSCSEATRKQNAWAVANGYDVVALDAGALVDGKDEADTVVASAAAVLSGSGKCLITTTGMQGATETHAVATERGFSAVEAGNRIAKALSRIVERILARCMPQGLIVAGGETSSTLMRALGLSGLVVGPNIEPGVPVCVALARPQLGVALKSGNFGSEDFYEKAIEVIRGLPVKFGNKGRDLL